MSSAMRQSSERSALSGAASELASAAEPVLRRLRAHNPFQASARQTLVVAVAVKDSSAYGSRMYWRSGMGRFEPL